MKVWFNRCSLVLLMFVLAACGGGSGSGAGTTGSAKTTSAKGALVITPVVGMTYKSGTLSGNTKDGGQFEYQSGNKVTFQIGDILIGETSGSADITLLHFVPGSDASTVKVVNTYRFIKAISSYNAQTDSFTVSENVAQAAKGVSIDFETISEVDLLGIIKTLTNDPASTLMGFADASSELAAKLLKYYAGTYAGSFTGPASSSIWELTINPNDGTVSGKGLDGLGESINGTITNGIVFNGKAEGGCLITGKIDVVTGKLTGNWYFNFDQRNGTFTGSRQN